jgi:hypothetical protein
MSHLAELFLNAVTTLFLGMAPERPLWVRRVVQAFWLLLAALVLLAWVFGLAVLIRAL